MLIFSGVYRANASLKDPTEANRKWNRCRGRRALPENIFIACVFME